MLVVHHLGRSQSERIPWLCEELGLPYELRRYDRDPVTMLAPPEYKALHPIGAAPVIEEDGVVLAESGAVVEWLLARHGKDRLAVAPGAPGYADYLYWLHFANGTLQPAIGRMMILGRLGLPADNPVHAAMQGRMDRALGHLEARLAAEPWLAGEAFTAAEVMTVFSVTTMRIFRPFELGPWPAIRAWLARIGERPAYRAAMAKADPGFAPMLA